MKTIYKYPLLDWSQTIQLPKDAQVLTAAKQGDNVFVWALVDTTNEPEPRTFTIIGTGNEIVQNGNLHHINTIFDNGFVWHIFEVK